MLRSFWNAEITCRTSSCPRASMRCGDVRRGSTAAPRAFIGAWNAWPSSLPFEHEFRTLLTDAGRLALHSNLPPTFVHADVGRVAAVADGTFRLMVMLGYTRSKLLVDPFE